MRALLDDVGGEGQNQDGRVRRIDLAIEWIARQIGRQLAARGVDRRLHIARGRIDVPVQVELQ